MFEKAVIGVLVLCGCLNVHASPVDGLDAFLRKDYVRAEKELTAVADDGNDDAQMLLARIYLIKAEPKNSPSMLNAIRYLNKAVSAGNNEAKTTLGTIYLTGSKVDTDVTKGTALLKDAADQTYLPAIVILAQYYETGIYLEMDFAKARDLFERGVAVNDVGSMLGLAEMYEAGKGVEKNQFKAFHYILMAASTLNPYGQAVLGSAYEYGKYGIKIDMKQAIRWYDAAAKQGNYLAQDALTRLGVKKKYPS